MYKIVTIHDDGDRTVLRATATSEQEALKKGRDWYDRGYAIVDVLKCKRESEPLSKSILIKTYSTY